MKNQMAATVATTACFALAACNPSGAVQPDSNLQCAALISASTYLMTSGAAKNDQDLKKRALVTSMTYLNAHAIPKKMKEPEAFAQLKALRETLMEAEQPADIMSRAKRCVDRSPV